MIDWLSWLAHLGAAQGIILALAIVTVPYGNRQANRILACFLLAESLRLLSLSYYYFEVALLPHLPIYQLHNLSYAFGPLLYLYAHCLVDREFTFRVRDLWHFTPVILAVIFFMPGLFVTEELWQYGSYRVLPQELKAKISLVTLPVYISLSIYSALALRDLQRHQMNIRIEFSTLETVNLKWLKWLMWLCLFSATTTAAAELLQAMGLVEFNRRVVVSVVTSVAIIYYIGLMGLRQPRIFDQAPTVTTPSVLQPAPRPEPAPVTEGEKYSKSGLREEDIQCLWQNLTGLMAKDKLYTRAGLKLNELARVVGSRPDYVSQVINTMSGTNFYEFINSYRIDEACRQLQDDPGARRNIADIAQDAGFTSLNIFNRHFKRIRGTTPSAYRKVLSAQKSSGDPVG